jgi:PAS domain S-box-containing protein
MPNPRKSSKPSQQKGRQPKTSEQKTRNTLDTLSEMVFEADKLGTIVYANRIALETLGYTQGDLEKGVNILDLVAQEDVDKAAASLFKFSSGDHPQEELGLEEYTIKKADGTKLPIAIHVNRILNSRGILFNTTESKQFKAALQKSEEKLRFILNAISDGIIVTDLEGKIVDVNNATLHKAGYTRKEEIIGQSAFEFIVQKDQQRFQKDFVDTISKNAVTDKVEYTLWAVDGKKFDAEISAVMLRDSNGNPTGFIGVIRDITDRKKLEQYLKGREERLQAIVENAPDAIFIYDNNGILIDGNRKAEELTGYSKEEFIGKNAFDMGVIAEEYVPMVLEKLKHYRGIPGGPQEVELINKQGRRISIEVTVFPVTRQGNVEVIGIARDITERKRLEQELNKHRHHLEELVEQRTKELTLSNQQLQQEIAERTRAEEGLRASEEKLRFIFEAIEAGIIATDLEFKIIEINDAALRMTGYTREELIGKSGLDFISTKDRSGIIKDINKIYKEKQNSPLTYDFIAKNGSTSTIEVSSTLLHDTNGNPSGFIVIIGATQTKI